MMMQEAVKSRELISALADGELDGQEFARAVDWIGHDDDARRTWHAYHLVGDVLRAGDAMTNGHEAEFLDRLKLRLAQEKPLVSGIVAIDSIAIEPLFTGAGSQKDLNNGAANDDRFHWKWVAGLASVLAVASIGLLVSRGWDEQRTSGQLAQAAVQVQQAQVASPVVVGGESQVMIRDLQLDALLSAHKQFGGTSALQVPTGFLRNATFEGAAR